MATNGRIEAARQRVASLKKTLAIASAGVFAVAVGVARAADAHGTRGSTGQVAAHQDDGSTFFGGDDGGSLAPSQGPPQVRTGSS
jgi:hypothetical protein